MEKILNRNHLAHLTPFIFLSFGVAVLLFFMTSTNSNDYKSILLSGNYKLTRNQNGSYSIASANNLLDKSTRGISYLNIGLSTEIQASLIK